MKSAPNEDDIDRFQRWFAARSNDRSWTLAEQSARTAAEDDEMLLLATFARVPPPAIIADR